MSKQNISSKFSSFPLQNLILSKLKTSLWSFHKPACFSVNFVYKFCLITLDLSDISQIISWTNISLKKKSQKEVCRSSYVVYLSIISQYFICTVIYSPLSQNSILNPPPGSFFFWQISVVSNTKGIKMLLPISYS